MAIRWPHRAQLRASLALADARPAYTIGLRAAVVTVAPLLLGELTGQQAMIWMAIGGWLGTLADPGGPYLARAQTIGGFAISGALVAAIATLAEGAPPAVGLGALFVAVFLTGLWRVRGDAQATVGLLLAIVFAIALGVPGIHNPPIAALLRAALLLAGGCFTLILSVGLWPFQPYRPARRALGDCYRALATNAADLRKLLIDAEEREEAWYEIGRRDRPAARAALERARVALAMIRKSRQGESDRGERLLFLFELGDLLLGDFSALSEVLRAQTKPEQERAAQVLEAMSTALAAVAVQIEDEKSAQQALSESARPPLAPQTDLPAPLPAASQRALTALAISAGLSPTAGHHKKALMEFEPPAPRPSLRDALDLKSEALRHALRLAIATTCGGALGVFLSEFYKIPRVPWLTVTILIVLQPQAGTTLARAVQRVGGTVLGGLAAALLAPVSHHPLWYAALLFVLSLLAVSLKPLSYGLFAALLTPVFVLMAEQQSGSDLVVARIVNTLLGGAVALLFGIVLWPSWERARLPAQLAALLKAARALLDTVNPDHPGDLPQARRARRHLGLALANAESTFQRFLGEPHDPKQVQATMALLVGARRMAGLLISLAGAAGAGPLPSSDRAQIAAMIETLDGLADAVSSSQTPAPLPAGISTESLPMAPGAHAQLLARISRQLALLHLAADRLLKPAQ
jgi:uncharacterized membrane protein YccC